MIDREWHDLGNQADELHAHFRGKPPEWWAALNAIMLLEALGQLIEEEPGSRNDDDDWWKK